MSRISGPGGLQHQASANAARNASGEYAILVNGEQCVVPSGCTVTEMLALLEVRGRRVAVAINRSVAPRSTHATLRLQPGDDVEILEAVGGG